MPRHRSAQELMSLKTIDEIIRWLSRKSAPGDLRSLSERFPSDEVTEVVDVGGNGRGDTRQTRSISIDERN